MGYFYAALKFLPSTHMYVVLWQNKEGFFRFEMEGVFISGRQHFDNKTDKNISVGLHFNFPITLECTKAKEKAEMGSAKNIVLVVRKDKKMIE
jgi:hypothetical protein